MNDATLTENRQIADAPWRQHRVIVPEKTAVWRDYGLLLAVVTLALFGVVMIASASLPFAEQSPYYASPFYFVNRQLVFLALGLLVAFTVYRIPLARWERAGPLLMIASMFALLLVLVPGIGKEVNGARRWIDLGLFTVQVSEAVKLFIVVYLAGYLVRRGDLVQNTWGGFIRPLVLISLVSVLLILEPDFGAAAVILGTSMLMFFVARVKLQQFVVLLLLVSLAGAMAIATSPYRVARVTAFLAPFDDPFGAGFQLAQSLIAVGSGGLFGVGLGSSVQKNFYLPEAHTDFLFAVIAEELGFLGVVGVISLFAFIIWRCFRLSRDAELVGNMFASYMAIGIGSWIGLQSSVNIGVSLGMFPTKGITLPFISYGGSSAVIFAAAFALLLRAESEVRQALRPRLDSMTERQPDRSGQERRLREAGRELADNEDGFDETLWRDIQQRLNHQSRGESQASRSMVGAARQQNREGEPS